MKKLSKLANLALAAAAFGSLNAHASITLLDKDDWSIKFSGFTEMDMIDDTTRSLTEVVGSTAVAKPGTYNGDNGRTQFSLRNSRFAFNIAAPTSGSWKTRGYLEFDLLGNQPAVSEASYYTNPTLRMRHAYLSAESDGWQILAGQYWTLFGWVPNYVLSTVSVAPVTGTVYERTPQLTVMKAFDADSNVITAGVSIARPAQKDGQQPNFDGGLKWAYKGRRSGFMSPTGDIKVEPMNIALTGTLRKFDVASADGSNGMTNYSGAAWAVNATIPVIASESDKSAANSLTLAGSYTNGKGYGDAFPSWSGGISALPTGTGAANSTNLDAGQGGFDASGNFQLLDLQTWNTQVQYYMSEGMSSFLTAGYGQLFSDNVINIANATAGAIYDRSEAMYVNFGHDFSNQVRAMFEFDRFHTHYVDDTSAFDNRYQVSIWYRF